MLHAGDKCSLVGEFRKKETKGSKKTQTCLSLQDEVGVERLVPKRPGGNLQAKLGGPSLHWKENRSKAGPPATSGLENENQVKRGAKRPGHG